MADIHTDLQTIAGEIDTAQGKIADLQKRWRNACGAGLMGMSEELELAIEKEQRNLRRLEMQYQATAEKCAAADELAHQIHLAGLTAQAAADIEAVERTLKTIAPLTAQLAIAVTALEVQANAVRESRIYAKQAGATVTSLKDFASQEQAALVAGVVDSLSNSRKAIAHIAQYLARLSMS